MTNKRTYFMPWIAMPTLVVLMIAYYYCLGVVAFYLGVKLSLIIGYAACWLVLLQSFWNLFEDFRSAARFVVALVLSGVSTLIVIVVAWFGVWIFAWNFPQLGRH